MRSSRSARGLTLLILHGKVRLTATSRRAERRANEQVLILGVRPRLRTVVQPPVEPLANRRGQRDLTALEAQAATDNVGQSQLGDLLGGQRVEGDQGDGYGDRRVGRVQLKPATCRTWRMDLMLPS